MSPIFQHGRKRDRAKPQKHALVLRAAVAALTATTLFSFGINRDDYTFVSRMQLGLEEVHDANDAMPVPVAASGVANVSATAPSLPTVNNTAIPSIPSDKKRRLTKKKKRPTRKKKGKKRTHKKKFKKNPKKEQVSENALNTAGGNWSPPEDFKLTPLRQIDIEQYTVRINSWKRQEQLEVTIHHYLTCEGVAQIQIVWCDAQGPPSASLLELAEKNSDRLVFEHHDLNSLNERFRVLIPTPTLGVMHVDDDILRPCEAMDAGFFKWTQAPHRMVGFDARGHGSAITWKYNPLNVSKGDRSYSMALTKFCFTHRDYLDAYIRYMPKPLLDRITDSLNCEDIAMTLFISALTHGQAPLLADIWAMLSLVRIHSDSAIGGGRAHFLRRSNCVEDFSLMLGLKDKNGPRYLTTAKMKDPNSNLPGWLSTGAPVIPEDNTLVSSDLVKGERQIRYEAMVESWRADGGRKYHMLWNFREATMAVARRRGLIKGTDEWRERQNRLRAERDETARG